MNRLQAWLFVRQIAFLFKKRDYARAIVICLFFSILVLLAVLSFFLGKLLMDYIESFDFFSKSFLYVILLSLMSSVSILSLLSFIIAFLKTLFDRQLVYFFLLPFQSYKVVLPVFIRTLAIGSWPYFLLSLPFFFGMMQIGNTPIVSYFLVIILHILISVILASAGGTLAVGLFLILGRRLTSILPTILVLGFLGLFLLFSRFIFPTNLEYIFSQKEIWQIERSLNTLPLALPNLPTTLFVDSFLKSNFSTFLLFVETCLAVTFFILVVELFYKKAWQINYEGYLLAGSRSLRPAAAEPRYPTDIFPKTVYFAFVKKEILSFRRTTSALIYLSFIIFLASISIFFLSKAGRFQFEYERFIPVVNLAAFFGISYLILLFTIRFIFPTFAIERSFIWSIITTVAIRRKLSFFKWTFYHLLILALAFILGIITSVYYKVPTVGPHEISLLLIGNALLMTTFALLVGQFFQRELPKENVEDISTTIPGILVTTVSLMSGLIIAGLFFFFQFFSLYWILTIIAISFLLLGYRFSYHRYLKSNI